jgi:hypothetical protein
MLSILPVFYVSNSTLLTIITGIMGPKYDQQLMLIAFITPQSILGCYRSYRSQHPE